MTRAFDDRIPSALQRHFSAAVRRRGAAYWHEGRVRLLERGPARLAARVRGSSLYTTALEADGEGVVSASCDCPYGESSGDPCKHLWATILEGALHVDFRDWLVGDEVHLAIVDDLDDLDDLDDSLDDEDGLLDAEDPSSALPTAIARPPSGRPDAHPPRPRTASASSGHGGTTVPALHWRQAIARAARALPESGDAFALAWPAGRRIAFQVDLAATLATGRLLVEVCCVDPRPDGTPGRERALALSLAELDRIPSPAERELLGRLFGARAVDPWGYDGDAYAARPLRAALRPEAARDLVPALARSGALRLRQGTPPQLSSPLAWQEEPWRFALRAQEAEQGSGWWIDGLLRRSDDTLDLQVPRLLLASSLVFGDDWAAPLEDGGGFAWIALLREQPRLFVSEAEQSAWLAALYSLPRLPSLELPERLRPREAGARPEPGLVVGAADAPTLRARQPPLALAPFFRYGSVRVAAGDRRGRIFDPAHGALYRRDPEGESHLLARLTELGARTAPRVRGGRALELPAARFVEVAHALLSEGWQLEGDGGAIRRAPSPRLRIASGTDWFDVRGEVDFGGATATLAEILAARRRGQRVVRLGDGSIGLLPQEWLARNLPWLELGDETAGALRFTRAQAPIVAAELAREAERDEAAVIATDAAFRRLRDKLLAGAAPEPAAPPRGFRGTLRPYQRIGLGWLRFLAETGVGGCLADDMGLGKTVQILALLAGSRREAERRPSLVVAPRTLLFNWRAEAARFAPRLELHEHHGAGRARSPDPLRSADLVLTTYDLLRRDVELLAGIDWRVVVLDEAQAIKNEKSLTARAARRLPARLRLAATGTPVENHLGELRSLFEFLNPGLLRRSSLFGGRNATGFDLPEETRARLARALTPFLLRRTKAQVAPELPPRTEQTIHCELEGRQRRLYDELRDHYRRSLAERIRATGLAGARMHVLEALLRLRQAACHSGLLGPRAVEAASAKFEALLPRLEELVGEGHKALVFSQFTQLLALLRAELDRAGLAHAYLDGKTRDRAAAVAAFEAEEGLPIFLVSLKAGGTGLNLTAAGYVFLLDPWWNPAVEAQAIDRTHRIGQQKPVFAYRLIARDTVEERILDLQDRKRELAEALLAARTGPLSALAAEDLDFLLS